MGRRREIEIEIAAGRSFLFIILLVAVVLVALVGTSQADPRPAPPAAPVLWPMVSRSFYVTPAATFQGDEALTACAAGYHMASLWEVFDVSNVTYETALGFAGADAGEGPPTGVTGWMRTGYHSADGTAAPAVGNCQAWTSDSIDHHGTVMFLGFDWSAQRTAISPWEPITTTAWIACNQTHRVWCARPVQVVFLPLVLRNY